MAVIRIRRRPNAGARIGSRGERTFKRTYLIDSDVGNELRSAILNHPLTPKYGAPHPEDFTCTCSDIDLTQMVDNPRKWELTATWTSLHDNDRDEKDNQKSPPDRRPIWSARFRPLPTSRRRDLDGKLFADSACTPFSPPPDLPIYVDEITIQRWETSWDRKRDRGYLNATNTRTWQNSQPGEAVIDDIDVQEVYEFGQYWYRYTYKILDNPKIVTDGGIIVGGWDPLYVLDAGPQFLDLVNLTNGKPTPTPIKSGDYVDGVAKPLDGHGQLLGRDNQGKLLQEIYLTFRVKNKVDYTPLKLDPPWKT